ncbi:MAG: hypothetical protein C0597_16665 [Marinilabiliales bacterium]|nr:MAG: hypothetical protein C0597_16665 [Marinilabiliales bacterium]
MIRLYLLIATISWFQILSAQKNNIKFIDLPDDFNTELEISGMIGHENSLYLVSEREKIIYQISMLDYSITSSIDLRKPIITYNSKKPENEIDIRGIEMEGLSWYKNQLLFVDEGNTAIYRYDLDEETISKIKTNLDLSDFNGDFGMEGIAVNKDKKLVYILRERNGNNQSEIYTLKMSPDKSFKYYNQKYIIDHKDNNWRYSDIYYDSQENIIYALRSYYNKKDPEAAKCYIDKIPVNKKGIIDGPIDFNEDEMLSNMVVKNRCKYVSNLEGIYKTGNKVFIVSDNARSTKKCDSKPIKTMFIEYTFNKL